MSTHSEAESTDYRARVYQHYLKTSAVGPEASREDLFEPRRAYLARVIRESFPTNRDATILDLGCGHGALLYFAREAGYTNIFGIDRSPEQVATARRFGLNGVKEGELLPFLRSSPPDSHDVVVTFDVLEHLRKEELLPVVDEVLRVLRPQGKWLIHTPNGESPFCTRVRYGDLTHEQAFTRSSLDQLLKSSGFTATTYREETPTPHGLASGVRWVLWRGIRAALRFYLAVETGETASEVVLSQSLLAIATK